MAVGFGVGGVLWWGAYATPRDVPELEGLREAQIRERLGTPTDSREFTMAECCDEMRIELHETYPPGAPDASTITIRELTWDRVGHTTVAWLHRRDGTWIVLDTLRYPEGTAF